MILYGSGGHAKVIIDILDSMGIVPEFIVDDNPQQDKLMGIPVKTAKGLYTETIISVGNNEIRKKISERITPNRYLTAIASSALVSKHATIGEGSVVMQGAIIQSCARIGKHCIINTGATIDHDCIINDFVHISPNATLCGNVEVGEGTWIGAGAIVRQGVKIGAWSIIGAGSVVVENIPDNVTAVGNKCKIIKTR